MLVQKSEGGNKQILEISVGLNMHTFANMSADKYASI